MTGGVVEKSSQKVRDHTSQVSSPRPWLANRGTEEVELLRGGAVEAKCLALMNRVHLLIKVSLCLGILALSGFKSVQARGLPSPTPTPGGKTARLIVQRAPNFGSDLFIRLSIDGKPVASIPRNQHFGGVVSAGRHTIAAMALPNTEQRRPTSMRLNAKTGQVYIFTASWNADRLVLIPSTYYSPTTRVGEVKKKKRKLWFW